MRKKGEIEKFEHIGKTDSGVRVDPRRAAKLDGLQLSPRQRRLIYAFEHKPTTLTDAGRIAGYTGNGLLVTIYKDIKNPKIIKGLRLYYEVGDKGLGDIACGALSHILTSKDASYDQQINASKLALQVAGKLKNMNYEIKASIPEDQIKECIAHLLEN